MQPGDYIVRGDQPYRTIADMYFSLQNFSPSNPSPYDDTGWTFQLMRNIDRERGDRHARSSSQPMTPVTSPRRRRAASPARARSWSWTTPRDNNLMTFRFRFPKVRMLAAEDDFDAAGQHFGAGAFIIPNADRAALEPSCAAWACRPPRWPARRR